MSARDSHSALAWPVRPAGPGDADAIQALMVAATIRSVWPTLAAPARDAVIASYHRRGLRQRLADPEQRFWVALDAEGGDICGVIALQGPRHLQYLFVRPRWQRHGIGARLWEVARQASHAQAPADQPYTVNASLNAVPAYQRLGFVTEGPAQEQNGWRWQAMRHAG